MTANENQIVVYQPNEAVGTPTLEKICRVLQCNIGDIMDYVPDEPENKEGKGLTK